MTRTTPERRVTVHVGPGEAFAGQPAMIVRRDEGASYLALTEAAVRRLNRRQWRTPLADVFAALFAPPVALVANLTDGAELTTTIAGELSEEGATLAWRTRQNSMFGPQPPRTGAKIAGFTVRSGDGFDVTRVTCDEPLNLPGAVLPDSVGLPPFELSVRKRT
jgi:hypothetical protein